LIAPDGAVDLFTKGLSGLFQPKLSTPFTLPYPKSLPHHN